MKKNLKLMWIAAVCLAVCLSMSACSKTDNTEVKDIFKEAEERVKPDEAQKPIEKTAEPAGETKELTLGEINGDVYSNDYFGFEFTFPNNLDKVYSSDEVMTLTKGFNKVSSSEEIDLKEQGQLFLFTARGNKNTSFLTVQAFKIGAVTVLGEITTAEEFLENNIGFEEPYDDIELNDIESTKLGTKAFKYWKQSFGTEKYYEYACEANGYVISFQAQTTIDYDEAEDDIEAFINSINFK